MKTEIDALRNLVYALDAADTAGSDAGLLYTITTAIRANVAMLEEKWLAMTPPAGPMLIAESIIRNAYKRSPAIKDRQMYLMQIVDELQAELKQITIPRTPK